jgi:hypothetical protein
VASERARFDRPIEDRPIVSLVRGERGERDERLLQRSIVMIEIESPFSFD